MKKWRFNKAPEPLRSLRSRIFQPRFNEPFHTEKDGFCARRARLICDGRQDESERYFPLGK